MTLNTCTPVTQSPPPYLPLPNQLSLQVVDLEEGAVGADSAEGPDRPHGPPGQSGGALDLLRRPAPEAPDSGHVAAARGERPAQAAV